MSQKYSLAIDIGASSGRHILGYVHENKLVLEEIYRFENQIHSQNGKLTWDVERLTSEVIAGLKKCKEIGKIPATVAIDTWGVDYVLFDRDANAIPPVYCYRDGRTTEMLETVERVIPYREIYARTGIQQQPFNTMYQLLCDKAEGRLNNARSMLLLPDYLSYRLTDIPSSEYTIATTTGLIHAETKQWDLELIDRLGLPTCLFGELHMPGTLIGKFSKQIESLVGYSAEVIHAAGHDTASAVAACPLDKDTLYISSGTWSLVGTESMTPVINDGAYNANLTNEGGVEYRFRVLKNIMGMWMLQCIRKELDKKISYDEMADMAENSRYSKTFDCNDASLTAPTSMISAIENLLQEKAPIGDLLRSVYHSLAISYQVAADEVERTSGKKINKILIVGGGSKNTYLNVLTGQLSGRSVYTGLTEATAVGNLLTQIMYLDHLTLDQARRIVQSTFPVKRADI